MLVASARWTVLASCAWAVLLEAAAALTTVGFLATQTGVLSLGLAAIEGAGLAVIGLRFLRQGQATGVAAAFGLAGGSVYVCEIGLEYALRPPDNTPFGYVEYALVLLTFLAAGATAGWRARSVRSGALAGALTGLVAVSLWLAMLWTVFLLFRGSALQADIFRAEGNYEDFKRSGLNDFNVFVVGDTLGATIFHPVLNLAFGVVLGTLGAAGGKLARWAAGSKTDSVPAAK